MTPQNVEIARQFVYEAIEDAICGEPNCEFNGVAIDNEGRIGVHFANGGPVVWIELSEDA